jgi:hypothetical protein
MVATGIVIVARSGFAFERTRRVPLSVLLERAGLADEVCELVLEGADRGVPREELKP